MKAECERAKAFEAKRNIVRYSSQETDHIAAGCRKLELVFSCVNSSDKNLQLFPLYVRDLLVNRKECKELRDSTATIDAVHPAYVDPSDLTGDCERIRQVVQEDSVCLTIAEV